MDIQIIPSLKEAERIRGLTVVIDVLRAFTTTCYLFSNGASGIYAVADLAEAYAIKKSHPDYILAGERKGLKQKDFDFGNSPAEIKSTSFDKKTVILTTSAGTQGIHKARHSEEVITGAFVNAGAVASYIRRRNPYHVTFLCTDDWHPENEDIMCARYIQSLLLGRPMNFNAIKTHMKTHPSADGFLLHPMTEWSKDDFYMCMTLDTFDFVVKAKDGAPILLEKLALPK